MAELDNPSEKTKKAILYFQKITEEEKAIITSNVRPSKIPQKHKSDIVALLWAIQSSLGTLSETEIIKKLIELGINNVYATLLTQNIIKEAPTLEFQLALFSKINDDIFKKYCSKIYSESFVNNMDIKLLSNEINVTVHDIEMICEILKSFSHEYCRGTMSEPQIIEHCKNHGVNDYKIDILINTIKVNSDFWHKTLVFFNAQEGSREVKKNTEQNKEIMGILTKILKVLTEATKQSSTTQHSQYS